MQTFSEVYAGALSKPFNVTGRYFVLLGSTNAVNVRFYLGGKLLDLGAISGLLAGLEVGPLDKAKINGAEVPFAFDQVQVESTGADTITFGIGNGQVRYNRSASTATVVSITNQSSTDANTNKTVTNATAQLIAANAARRYLLIQNKDPAGRIWINHGAGAATTANGVLIEPGGYYERSDIVPTGAIQAIGDAASNANIVVVEA